MRILHFRDGFRGGGPGGIGRGCQSVLGVKPWGVVPRRLPPAAPSAGKIDLFLADRAFLDGGSEAVHEPADAVLDDPLGRARPRGDQHALHAVEPGGVDLTGAVDEV